MTQSFTSRFLPFVIGLVICVLLMNGCTNEPVFTGSETEATSFARQAVTPLMNKHYPNTGYEPRYDLHRWNYDAESHEYSIEMSAYWMGRSCLLCDDECQVEVRGYLTVNENGSNPRFEITAINDCVRQHNLTGLVIGTVLDIAASN